MKNKPDSRCKGPFRSASGQAMLEYVLLTSLIAIAAFATYVPGGWLSSIQQYVSDVLVTTTLPVP